MPGIDGFQRIESSALFDEDSIGGLGPDEGLEALMTYGLFRTIE
jgi:hypothetical protein